MYETELKARVRDREKVVLKLNSFAEYCGAVQKSDAYYGLPSDEKKRLRIRKTTFGGKESVVLTYKKKELKCSDGRNIEFNDEKECVLSSAEPLETFLNDAGFKIVLTKEKSVESWKFEDALFELCAVPPLGDFLEIEILLSSFDEGLVRKTQKKLLLLLSKCGIEESCIEEKYYSELLEEHQNKK